MNAHTLRITALAAIALAAAAAPSMHANTETSRTQYLTFSRPVALPGVALRAGTYIFELPDRDAAPDIVRVTSRDRKIVYFTAFTQSVDRPSGVAATDLVSLREAGPDRPAPIAVWWSDARTGRQFLYR